MYVVVSPGYSSIQYNTRYIRIMLFQVCNTDGRTVLLFVVCARTPSPDLSLKARSVFVSSGACFRL